MSNGIWMGMSKAPQNGKKCCACDQNRLISQMIKSAS